MRLTSLADYAVVVMAAAARRPAGARLSAGLLESARGTGGGFRLARAATGISLADIIEAVEGPIAMTNCIEGSIHDCALEGSCRVKPHLNAANDAVRGALAAVSLSQLSQPPVRPELVEGLSVTAGTAPGEAGFDSPGFNPGPNDVGTEAGSR